MQFDLAELMESQAIQVTTKMLEQNLMCMQKTTMKIIILLIINILTNIM